MDNVIHIKGARTHNLRDVELKLPRNLLTVITGVSGSGKSSLAFDTLHAEGSRQYLESLSTRARGLLEAMPRPDVDFIHGLSPVIAIAQRTGGATNPRSTVASITEIADHARLLWSLAGDRRCPHDGGAVTRRSLDDCLAPLLRLPAGCPSPPRISARPQARRSTRAPAAGCRWLGPTCRSCCWPTSRAWPR